jgi:hypothetical protein
VPAPKRQREHGHGAHGIEAWLHHVPVWAWIVGGIGLVAVLWYAYTRSGSAAAATAPSSGTLASTGTGGGSYSIPATGYGGAFGGGGSGSTAPSAPKSSGGVTSSPAPVTSTNPAPPPAIVTPPAPSTVGVASHPVTVAAQPKVPVRRTVPTPTSGLASVRKVAQNPLPAGTPALPLPFPTSRSQAKSTLAELSADWFATQNTPGDGPLRQALHVEAQQVRTQFPNAGPSQGYTAAQLRKKGYLPA